MYGMVMQSIAVKMLHCCSDSAGEGHWGVHLDHIAVFELELVIGKSRVVANDTARRNKAVSPCFSSQRAEHTRSLQTPPVHRDTGRKRNPFLHRLALEHFAGLSASSAQ